MSNLDIIQRPRRNRRNSVIRNLMAETQLPVESLIWPLFILDQKSGQTEIKSMPGQFRWGHDQAIEQMQQAFAIGVKTFALFPVIQDKDKDENGSKAWDRDHSYMQFLKRLRQELPEAVLIADVALDPYTSHGHDGIVKGHHILNDETVEVLCKMALIQAEVGVDIVAPSDMMDGRIGAIRQALDQAGHINTSILSYTLKYASAYYGPFRDALGSAPKFGDKKTYQMDFRNKKEIDRELQLDLSEGADMVMVKPALAYLDVISRAKQLSSVPVAAYNVSGEYAMVKFAAQAGAIDEQRVVLETMYAIRRAGADCILTYHAKDIASWIYSE